MKLHSFQAAAAAAVFACCAAPAARAHVTLEYPVASAGGSYKATFRIGHGCGASATRQVVVQIPAGVRGAKPMVKPGWSAEVVKTSLAQPESRHGRAVTEDVVRITWTAKTPGDVLPADQYDEFSLVATLPEAASTLYWPVSQVCLDGRLDWTEVPAAGQRAGELKAPAAALELIPAGAGRGHSH